MAENVFQSETAVDEFEEVPSEKPARHRTVATAPELSPAMLEAMNKMGNVSSFTGLSSEVQAGLKSDEARPAEPSSYVDRGLPLPDSYAFDRLAALVRDPRWIFCYWELTGTILPELRNSRGQEFIDACAWVLRVYRVNENVAVDMEVEPSVGHWYVNVGTPGRFVFELALLSPDGEWISLLVSQLVETPLAGPSPVYDEEWRMRPEDEERLNAALREIYGLADAARRGTSAFLGASRVPGSRALVSSLQLLGSSASGRPVAGSWAWSALGASRVSGSGSGSGGFGWMVSPTGAFEPQLVRPTWDGGPNWNAQPNLPSGVLGKTAQPHFKVKLPRTLYNLPLPRPTWPPAALARRATAEKRRISLSRS